MLAPKPTSQPIAKQRTECSLSVSGLYRVSGPADLSSFSNKPSTPMQIITGKCRISNSRE